MGLEATTTIAGLVSTNPTSLDGLSQADDHFRLIKAVLKATFPGVGGSGFNTPITAKESEINYLVGVTSAVQTQLNSLSSLKAPLANPTFTGVPTAPTAPAATDSTQIATTEFVKDQLASPTFTGTVTAGTINATNTAKFFASASNAGGLGESFNMSSVTDGGTGIATFNFTTAVDVNFAASAGVLSEAGMARISSRSTTQIVIKCYEINRGAPPEVEVLSDPNLFYVMGFAS